MKRPNNGQRKTLSRQSLDCQTESQISGVETNGAFAQSILRLTIPVSPCEGGIEIQIFVEGVGTSTYSGQFLDAVTISFLDDQGASLFWFQQPLPQRTRSNGKLSQLPFFTAA
jgi:hypothetical protein